MFSGKFCLRVPWRYKTVFDLYMCTNIQCMGHAVAQCSRFPMVSLDCFIDIIFPAALWPCCRFKLQQKWVRGIFPGGWRQPERKADNLYMTIFLKSASLKLLEPSGPAQTCTEIVLYTMYFNVEKTVSGGCRTIVILEHTFSTHLVNVASYS